MKKTTSGLALYGRTATHSGFTIVELLIVIVVIAVLVTISVVAYTGIQQRAVNSKNANSASQAVKLLESYKALNGDYPPVSSVAVCVGEGFANNVGDANSDCWDSMGTNVVCSVDPTFNNALETVGSLPQAGTCIAYSTVCLAGAVYATSSAGNQPSPAGPSVRFWVHGANCPAGQKVWGGGQAASACALVLSD